MNLYAMHPEGAVFQEFDDTVQTPAGSVPPTSSRCADTTVRGY
jgi:hypothetical protein